MGHAGIAIGLGVKEDYFETAEAGGTTPDTSYWTARIIHYPPLSLGDFHRGTPFTSYCTARIIHYPPLSLGDFHRGTPFTSYCTARIIHYPPLSLGDFHRGAWHSPGWPLETAS
jgi:hypothetical protein